MIQTIGHRGAAALEPENTLCAIRKAIELGMDYVEFDIHRCKSGEIVLIHDDTVERITKGSGRVSEMTVQQLRKLDAGKGERIPTLQEAIDTCKGKIKMIIELKDRGLEKEVIDVLIKNGIPEAIIISFFHEFVKKAKEEAAGKKIKIKTGVILAGNPINVVEMARLANADYVTANHFYMDKEMAKKVKEAGLGLNVWTCNTEYDIKKAIAWGADMIASDNPELLDKVLGRK